MSLLKYKYQGNLHLFLLQVSTTPYSDFMFAHLRVTEGNESIFQFKVYGSVSYPQQYCNIYVRDRSHAKNIIGPFGESISLSITPFGT